MSGDPFRDRLARLRAHVRRDADAPVERSTEIDGADGELARARVHAQLARRGRAQARDVPAAGNDDRSRLDAGSLAGQAKGTGLPSDLTCDSTEGSGHASVVARETSFALDHRHGDWRLDEIASVEDEPFALLAGDEALAGIDLTRSVYLDTETTGLSGGAGTYVFLIGLGFVDGDRFRVWQGFLRGPADERALLACAAERIASRPSIVSFFGKSFDRHRLEDKMRLHGIAAPFAGRAHLDLFHPLRRLYAGAFENSRLRTLEAELCGVERENDLPGSRAPEAWFDYVYGRPHSLEGVFRHNLFDVLSLVTLASHLGRAVCETRACDDARSGHESLGGPPDARARGLARAWAACKRYDAALPWFETAIARTSERRGEAFLEGDELKLFRAMHARTLRWHAGRARRAAR